MQEFLRCKSLDGVKVSWLKFTPPPKKKSTHLSNSFVSLLSKSTMKRAARSLPPRRTESKKLNHSGSISQNPGKFVLFWRLSVRGRCCRCGCKRAIVGVVAIWMSCSSSIRGRCCRCGSGCRCPCGGKASVVRCCTYGSGSVLGRCCRCR
jgi:hypothetical protein